MNDEDYSNVYDRIQKEGMYDVPDQPGENDNPLYYGIREDLKPENHLYDTQLETCEYDSVSVYVVKGEENRQDSSQPEAEGYLQPDEVQPEAQDPKPAELQEDRDNLMKELDLTAQAQELLSEEPCSEELHSEDPQENGSMINEDLPSPSSFTIQQSKAVSTRVDSPTGYSIANDLEEIEASSMHPEINLFVKVRAALESTSAHADV